LNIISKNDFLLQVCKNNSNINIIKYLIENLKLDINSKNNNRENCLLSSCSNNSNINIIKYLIEEKNEHKFKKYK